MRVTIDTHARDEIIRRFQDRLAREPRDMETPLHLSDVTGCITKSYYNRQIASLHKEQKDSRAQAGMIDSKSALYMYIGVLAEEALSQLAPEVAEVSVEGLIATADWELAFERFVELKTTRIYISKKTDMPSKGFPAEWLRRIAGYAYMYGVTEWRIGLVLVIPAEVKVYSFAFGQSELNRFWEEYILPRKVTLQTAISEELTPTPFQYNDDWECKPCPHHLSCQFGDQETISLPYNKDYMERHDAGANPLEPVNLSQD